MEVKATSLCNYTVKRNKRKQRKRTILSYKLVLTTKTIRAVVAAKEATKELKKNAKIAREQAKRDRQAAATTTKEQVKVRKKAHITATKLKKVANQHQRKASKAGKAAKKAQKAFQTASSIYKKKLTKNAL